MINIQQLPLCLLCTMVKFHVGKEAVLYFVQDFWQLNVLIYLC